MIQRDLHKALGDAERDDVGYFPCAVIVQDQIKGVAIGEQSVDHAPLDGIGALFRPLRFGSDVGLRPIPYLNPIGWIGLDGFTLRQCIEMAIDEERAVAEVESSPKDSDNDFTLPPILMVVLGPARCG